MVRQTHVQEYDAVVVGAGFSGLYQLHRFRNMGLSTRVFEAGGDVGGTWYWNRYPGARCDSQGYVYQYWFSDELLDEWNWSERFPAQPETERYLHYVADKFDLRRDIQFNTRVTAARFDESSGCWAIETDNGDRVRARYMVMAVGGLSEPKIPEIPGRDEFKGVAVHTARWPKEGIDCRNKRVAVLGTGATGIQVIQSLADEADPLVVFQRTPSYTIPMQNWELDEDKLAEIRENYDGLRHQVFNTFAGFDFDVDSRSFHELSPEEREQRLWDLWNEGTLQFWIGTFSDVLMDREANEYVGEFVRNRIRERVNDPETAEKLVPKSYPFGTRRVALENGYYEVFNQDNVQLVDCRETPIERITPNGIRTADGKEYELDVIIFATGFDASTGIYKHIDIRGRDGVELTKDVWSRDLRNYLGLQVHGFPNMFMLMGPLSPAAAFCNVPTCSQHQTDWICDAIQYLHEHGRHVIEPTADAEAYWAAHHDETTSQTLFPEAESWYMGSNIEGKQRRLLAYCGGVQIYHQICADVASKDYEGFVTA